MSIKKDINDQTMQDLQDIVGEKLTLGNLLLAIRLGEEVSQVDFAAQLEVSKQYLCDIEKGRRLVSPKSAADFAHKLGYSEAQFVRLCLQDMIDRDGINLLVDVKVA